MGRVERMVQAVAFGMMMGSERKIIRPASSLVPFPELADLCLARKWVLELVKSTMGWTLNVSDATGLIARRVSTESAPWVFRSLAAAILHDLELAGHLSDASDHS